MTFLMIFRIILISNPSTICGLEIEPICLILLAPYLDSSSRRWPFLSGAIRLSAITHRRETEESYHPSCPDRVSQWKMVRLCWR